jgi:hypothetical protein
MSHDLHLGGMADRQMSVANDDMVFLKKRQVAENRSEGFEIPERSGA